MKKVYRATCRSCRAQLQGVDPGTGPGIYVCLFLRRSVSASVSRRRLGLGAPGRRRDPGALLSDPRISKQDPAIRILRRPPTTVLAKVYRPLRRSAFRAAQDPEGTMIRSTRDGCSTKCLLCPAAIEIPVSDPGRFSVLIRRSGWATTRGFYPSCPRPWVCPACASHPQVLQEHLRVLANRLSKGLDSFSLPLQ